MRLRAVVKVVAPKVGPTVHDPCCCGTGGFLAEAYKHLRRRLAADTTPRPLHPFRTTFSGHEEENLIYPVTLADLVLHGIDWPNISHWDTLTGHVTHDGRFRCIARSRVAGPTPVR